MRVSELAAQGRLGMGSTTSHLEKAATRPDRVAARHIWAAASPCCLDGTNAAERQRGGSRRLTVDNTYGIKIDARGSSLSAQGRLLCLR